ncbi:MAG: RES domain-containing protein [Rubellimicrobium sp.]|nr:RES domain-containing protein [Rubellimicrobium sp.]
MTLPVPPARLPPPNSETLPAGAALFWVHRSDLEPAAFNPGLGADGRFSPITDRAGAVVPSLYAATSPAAAAFETIFHDVLPGPFASVPDAMLQARRASRLRTRRALTIVQLHAPDLRRWSLTPDGLIATPSRDYTVTARWAEAIHRQFADMHGLVWTSNRCDPERCYLFFGNRVQAADFDIAESAGLGSAGPARDAVVAAARRAGIVIVPA